MNSYLTIADAAVALRAGAITSVELVGEAIAVADALDGTLGMFLQRFEDSARSVAHEVDRRFAAGEDLGPLAGIPLGIKDLISTAEGPTTAQSTILEPAWAAGDAPTVARLRRAGGIIMGKHTTQEFAIGAPDPDKPFPLPRNPWDPDRWAGGSSSGSASGVATGAVLGALGTDTAGSIRIPSAFCGITGLKPTFGRVPKTGCVPLGHTLDHIGPLARSARDCALLLSVIAGHDREDPTCLHVAVPDYLAGLSADLTGLRIGVDRLAAAAGEMTDDALAGALDAAITTLADLGAEIVEVELPLHRDAMTAFMVIMLSEALAYHRPDLHDRWSDYSAGTRATFGSGVFYSGADYVQAQRVRRVVVELLAALYRQVDLVLTPTVALGAFPIATMTSMRSAVTAEAYTAIHTPYWDLTGNPVISVPIGYGDGGMPLGMQLAGRPLEEDLVLRAGDAYQQATSWHLNLPPLASAAAEASYR